MATNGDKITVALDAGQDAASADKSRTRSLGTVRLRHHQTNEIILIPTPSNNPNDPLNW
jgi:hypothetical protein